MLDFEAVMFLVVWGIALVAVFFWLGWHLGRESAHMEHEGKRKNDIKEM